MFWISLVLLYGLLKGAREIAKKKAMNKNSVMEVLFTYTLISFILVIPQVKDAGGMETRFYFYVALKSFFIFIAWICGFKSLKKLPVSIYGILDLSRVLFATFLGVLVLGETLNLFQMIGLVVVCSGLLLLRFKPPFLKKLFRIQDSAISASIENPNQNIEQKSDEKKQYSVTIYVILALICCVLNALSGLMDKILMKDLNSSQLQFWYMLFLVIYYSIYVLVKREKITLSILKNGWMWAMAIMFVIGDKALFIANGMDSSKITIMTLVKQFGCIVTIVGGKIFFKEKNIAYKLFCASVIIFGIVLGVLF